MPYFQLSPNFLRKVRFLSILLYNGVRFSRVDLSVVIFVPYTLACGLSLPCVVTAAFASLRFSLHCSSKVFILRSSFTFLPSRIVTLSIKFLSFFCRYSTYLSITLRGSILISHAVNFHDRVLKNPHMTKGFDTTYRVKRARGTP